jgi:hypothetical protein
VCHQCDELGTCEICEACERHCVARPNDLEAHRRAVDFVIASTDPEREPH